MDKLLEKLKRIRLVKAIVYTVVGAFSYPGLMWVNRLKIAGTEHIEKLPKENVLYVCNHQTYFADVIALLHIFCAVKWGRRSQLGIPFYLLSPFTSVHFVVRKKH
ncbi:MAG: 1-acyl-sn-glycerol-3-phosphate acyltransferase [Luteolibacter sp.]